MKIFVVILSYQPEKGGEDEVFGRCWDVRADMTTRKERFGEFLKRAVKDLPINSHLVIDCCRLLGNKESSGYGVEVFCDKGFTTLSQDNQKHHSLQVSVFMGRKHLCLSAMSE